MNLPEIDVTVVICTYNRAHLLRQALPGLLALETGGDFRYEVLVVDNASADGTAAVIAEAAGRAAVPFRSAYEARPGVACARNRGIAEARGPWIAFVDDDEVADPRWLAELLAVAREEGARLVGGANRLRFPDGEPAVLSPVCRSLLGETAPANAPRVFGGKEAPVTSNLLIQRSVFAEVGAFNEALREAGEDSELYQRIRAAGVVAWFAPAAVTYHAVPGYRLRRPYLRWTSLRWGAHYARQNWQDWGRLAVLLLGLRLGQALLLHGPRYLWERLRGTAEGGLGTRCLLWRAEGYARVTLNQLAPWLFAQRRFLSELDFRAERALFAAQ